MASVSETKTDGPRGAVHLLRPNISIFQKSIFDISSVKRVVAKNSAIYYVVDKGVSHTLWTMFLYLRWHQTYKHFQINEHDFFTALESLDDDNILMTFTETGEFALFPPKINDLEIFVGAQTAMALFDRTNFVQDVFFLLVFICILLCIVFSPSNFNPSLRLSGMSRYNAV